MFLRWEHFICFYNRSVFVKVKLEPKLANLNEISRALSCYSILAILKKNQLPFNKLFCFSNIFEWVYQSFTQALKPLYSEDGTNKKRLEITTYKLLIDFLEVCNFDGMFRSSLWNIFFQIVVLKFYLASLEQVCEGF